jgi:hypothetical protein
MDSQHKDLQAMKALVAAVVERACEDVELGGVLAAQAMEWSIERDSSDAWSFEWCCSILNLDPDAVRQKLTGVCHTPRAA